MMSFLIQKNYADVAIFGSPIGCAKEQFRPPFIPFGTTMWTFFGVYMQSTLWERFI
jgi:hypothetical protein